MKFDNIKGEIYDMISDRFQFENNVDFENELLSLADENLKYKGILRIKRLSVKVDSWKTLVLVEIESYGEKDIKVELRKAIRWIANIKESLLGVESTDLYLLLAFNSDVCVEECLRIESTEQLCRKYVLMPNEDISEFLNRTFLQKLVNGSDNIDGEDPLERAFSETAVKYSWLTSEIQIKWKKAFLELSGIELFDALLAEEDIV